MMIYAGILPDPSLNELQQDDPRLIDAIRTKYLYSIQSLKVTQFLIGNICFLIYHVYLLFITISYFYHSKP